MTAGLRSALDLVTAPFIHESVTRQTRHRPWPVPSGSWLMAQTWVDLLFAHWAVDAGALRSAVPPQLEIDQFDNQAWIAVTPFEVRHLRLRPTFPVPLISSFPEINVRTYVTYRGRPGIYFFSLDAASGLAVAAARKFYRLPYFRADMAIRRDREYLSYRSTRTDEGGPAAAFHGRYRPAGRVDPPPGSLERWLTERYCLYTLDEQERVLRGEIHHPQWRLCCGEAEIENNTMAAETGVELQGAPLLHYSARQDVVFWGLRLADG
jgi:uncharacterized protein YqjF (DUF2071 family)